MWIIRVGGECSEFLSITLLGRNRPGCEDYWDGNWVRASIEVAAGSFRDEVSGDLRTEELAAFQGELVPLAESLVGFASFSTMEGWLSITMTGDGHGHVSMSCELLDRPSVGNTLAFRLALDQTYLRPMIAQLAWALSELPVVGRLDA